jgi:hypothetical protein
MLACKRGTRQRRKGKGISRGPTQLDSASEREKEKRFSNFLVDAPGYPFELEQVL